MCGIGGVLGSLDASERSDSLGRMTDSLAHRGPDGRGRYEDAHIGLIHARLSIIDLSASGSQPFYNEDRSLVLICNGEIYNYREIRSELEQAGHKFSSTSDSEVIIHLYEEYKGDVARVCNRLTGMFAFAIWDIAQKRLVVARDRVGIKPLYYARVGDKFVFSSEVRPIFDSGVVKCSVDHTSIYEYFLLGSIPAPNTLYKEVKTLEAGCYLIVDGGKVTESPYWEIPKVSRHNFKEAAAQEELESLVTQVIKDHLIADVPVGTFLSAGVDSSLITALAVEQHPGINSFTASFPGEPEDEGVIANKTAGILKTTHFAYTLTNNFFDDFTSQFEHIDQPYSNPSALALGRISKLARKHVKVVLSGDGGDELFGGYNRYEFPKKPGFLKYMPDALEDSFLRIGAKVTGNSGLETLRKNLARTDTQIFMHKVALEKTQIVLSMFAPEIVQQIDTERYVRRIEGLFSERRSESQLDKVLFVDMKTTLVDEMLTKCDRMTMINGIEGRVPFLDHRLVEFAFSLPGEWKRQNGVGKLPLRKFLARKLGSELAYREKTGFKSPFKHWLNTDKATYDYVQENIKEVKKLVMLNADQLEKIAGDVNCVGQESVFALVCLNTFFKNITPGN